MKKSFKANIFLDKKNVKSVKINNAELKLRIKYILSLICDFSTELSIRFCDRDEILQANSSFRKKNSVTDVLSFPCQNSFPSENSHMYLGDILICIPVCIEQAKSARVSISQELEKMLIHGIVHLKGFDHERSAEAFRVMSSLEAVLQKELVKNLHKPTWCSAAL